MGKKIISIVLIITVNVFLLTSAVVPHHHHNGIPHFALSEHQEHDHESHENPSDCCSCPANESFCAFDQVDVLSQTREDCFCSLCHSHDCSGSLVQAILLFYTYNKSLTKDDLYSQLPPPYLISYHFDYASSGLGLRAPPVL